jgi:predicted nucleotidyltransferase
MKANANYLTGYSGWAVERLKAYARQFKEAAEQALEQPVKSIWAVGSIANHVDFDETSDIELIFELEDMTVEIDDQALQMAVELVESDAGFIQCYVDNPDPDEPKILIID